MKKRFVIVLLVMLFANQLIGQTRVIPVDSLEFSKEADTVQKQLPKGGVDYKKVIQELPQLRFYSGTGYFAGYGFQYVRVIDMRNRSRLKKALKQCRPGTSLILERCIIKYKGLYSQCFGIGLVLK